MRLQTKLLLTVTPLAAGLALVGVISLRAFDALGHGAQRILEDNYRSVLAAQRMKEAAERVNGAALFRAAGRPDAADAQPELARFEEELQVQERNLTESGEAQATQDLHRRFGEYRAAYARFASLTDAAQLQKAYFSDLRPLFVRLESAAGRVLQINQDAMVRKSDEARRLSVRSRSLLLFATFAALALGLFGFVSLTLRALRPLRTLSSAVRRIADGDLEARAGIAGNDEVAKVGHELDQLAEKLRQYRSSSLGELLQAQQASQAAIDSLPDPVLVFSNDGTVLNVNHAAETIFGVTAGADPLSRIPPAVCDVIARARAHVSEGKGPYVPSGFEEAVRLHEGSSGRALLPRATPLYSESGALAGATVVLEDVTRLLRFDELKNDLVATVAHEFRTPLTSLRMALHVLIEGIVGEINVRQADMLFAARDDCERLQRIVEDLLDLSRIQAGKVDVSLVSLPAKTLVDASVAAHQEAAKAASVLLSETLVEPILPVLVDPDRIELVFDNLIGNALRHTPSGSRIEIRAVPDGECVRFEVRDQGPGVPEEYQDRIFEKFFRVPGAAGQGVGLGLYITREIVLAHGGDIGVEGASGQGSCFWFTLRAAAARAAAG
ncbi:MAG TPA: ATP-binding protein [Myxococcales bacterium]|jgi:signal transduction histidine kinase/HAMP domain-containing protein